MQKTVVVSAGATLTLRLGDATPPALLKINVVHKKKKKEKENKEEEEEGEEEEEESGGDKVATATAAAGTSTAQWKLDRNVARWLKGDDLSCEASGATSNRHSNRGTKPRPERCHQCNLKFYSRNTFQSHIRRFHPEDLICYVCYHRAHTLEELSDHRASHFPSPAAEDERDMTCTDCGQSVTPKSRSACCRQHLHLLSGTSRLEHFMCERCGDTFTRRDSLMRHLAKHSGVKPFRCNDCFASFVAKRDLLSHLRLHKPGRRFRCTKCPGRGVAFLREGDLRRHLHIVHGVAGDGERLPWPCPVAPCDRSFGRRYRLHHHMRTAHQVIADGKRVEQHTCMFCGREFTRLHQLVLHCSVRHRGVEAASFIRAARAAYLRTQRQRKQRTTTTTTHRQEQQEQRGKEEEEEEEEDEDEDVNVTDTEEEDEEKELRAREKKRRQRAEEEEKEDVTDTEEEDIELRDKEKKRRKRMEEEEKEDVTDTEEEDREEELRDKEKKRRRRTEEEVVEVEETPRRPGHSGGPSLDVSEEEEGEPGTRKRERGGGGGRRGRRISSGRGIKRKRRMSTGKGKMEGERAILLDAACSEWTVH